MRGQLLAIVAVLACGIAAFVAILSVHATLEDTGDAYFERYRLPEVFAQVSDAPVALKPRIEEIPGVEAVETRWVETVTLDVRGLSEPALAQLVSLRTDRPPTFNLLHLRQGRLPRTGHADEAVVSEGFAAVHALKLGEELHVIVGERRTALRVVGIGISPEYIFSVPPGSAWPDDKRFGVFWMDARGLAIAAQREGRFNDVTLSIARDASLPEVLAHVDNLLRSYGGRTAYGRDRQLSARFVKEELKGLKMMGSFVPMLFLGVAAFLLNVVIARLVAGQRDQLAALKALGYSNLAVGLHYAEFMVAVVVTGCTLGVLMASAMGSGLLGVYHTYFKFPSLVFALQGERIAQATALAFAVGIVATLLAVRKAVALPPAEAMRPPRPATFKEGFLTRLGLPRLLGPAGRIVLRNVERRPLRTLMASLGLSMGIAIMISGTFSIDAMAYILEVNYEQVQREDMTVTLAGSATPAVIHDVEAVPGVLYAEPVRMAPVRLHAGHHSYESAILGIERGARLRHLIDADLQGVRLPAGGLLMTETLAERLELEIGDPVRVEILEGEARTRTVRLGGTIREMMGMSVYMELHDLHGLMGDGPRINGARILLDPARKDEVYRELKLLPRVAGATLRTAALDIFNETTGQFQSATAIILGFFASIITFGVVYNSARVVLAERARELASLRVLGFTRGEVSSVLLGELGVQLALAVPIGCWLGRVFAEQAMAGVDAELYRFPVIIELSTYLNASLLMLISGAATALLVRRKVDNLDMIAVLKTRE